MLTFQQLLGITLISANIGLLIYIVINYLLYYKSNS